MCWENTVYWILSLDNSVYWVLFLDNTAYWITVFRQHLLLNTMFRQHYLLYRWYWWQGWNLRATTWDSGVPRARRGWRPAVEAPGKHVHASLLAHLWGDAWPHLRRWRRRWKGLAVFCRGNCVQQTNKQRIGSVYFISNRESLFILKLFFHQTKWNKKLGRLCGGEEVY